MKSTTKSKGAPAVAVQRVVTQRERKNTMKKNITYGDKYSPAMEIAEQDAADAYFEELVTHNLKCRRAEGQPPIRVESEKVERRNLGYYAGYYAGYYDSETRERVERLFKCHHPIFGSIAKNGSPTSTEALAAGMVSAKSGIKMASKLFAPDV